MKTTIRLNGMKQKVALLSHDEVIQAGDFFCTVSSQQDVCTLTEQEFVHLMRNRQVYETKCSGDLVKEHPGRVYVRIINTQTNSSGKEFISACPECESHKIIKGKRYGQNCFICQSCDVWGPWRERLKVLKSKMGNSV